MHWASLYINFEAVKCSHNLYNLFTGSYVQWHIDGLLDGFFLATLVGTILGDYRLVHIHSYEESILHIMQGVLQQLMSMNEPKIN